MIETAAVRWLVVLLGRGVDRLGKGIRGAPRDALIAADVPPEARGRAFGFHRSADTAGAVVGPLLGVAVGLTTNHTAAWLLPAAYGAFAALTDGVGKAWISGLVPATDQGNAQGVFQGLTGLGVLTAGVWAGLAWGQDGQLPLLASGAAALVIAAALPFAAHSRTPTPA